LIDALKEFAVSSRASDVIDVALRIPLPRAKLSEMFLAYQNEHGAEFAAREAFALADAARKEELQLRSAESDSAPQVRAWKAMGAKARNTRTNAFRRTAAGSHPMYFFFLCPV
jgi:hypothetical protein